jgi:hypothetical protein
VVSFAKGLLIVTELNPAIQAYPVRCLFGLKAPEKSPCTWRHAGGRATGRIDASSRWVCDKSSFVRTISPRVPCPIEATYEPGKMKKQLICGIAAAAIGLCALQLGSPAYGRSHHVRTHKQPAGAIGIASYYEKPRVTASGEQFKSGAFTAAHRTLPLGTIVYVTSLTTGKGVYVRINDRGPYVRGRVIDLSKPAARAIGIGSQGLAYVRVRTRDGW